MTDYKASKSEFQLAFRTVLEKAESNDFVINLEDVTKWLDYNRKDYIKDLLTANFTKGVDFSSSYRKTPQGGRPSELILLTIDCFKQLCMLSQTTKGKEVRLWYLEVEKEWRELKQKQSRPQLISKREAAKESLEILTQSINALSLLNGGNLDNIGYRDKVMLNSLIINNARQLEEVANEDKELVQFPLSFTEIAQRVYGVNVKRGSKIGCDAHLGKWMVKYWQTKYGYDRSNKPERASKYTQRITNQRTETGQEIDVYVYEEKDWHLVGELLIKFGYDLNRNDLAQDL